MGEKLKKLIKISKEGIWLVLAVSIAANILSIIAKKDIIAYFGQCWASLLYMLGLLAGLALYREEKYKQGAELVQWVGLGNMFVYFVKFLTIFIATGLVEFNIIAFLIELIMPIILIVEALKVIRMTDSKEHSLGTTLLPISIIVLVCVIQIINVIMPIISLGSISVS